MSLERFVNRIENSGWGWHVLLLKQKLLTEHHMHKAFFIFSKIVIFRHGLHFDFNTNKSYSSYSIKESK